MNHMLNDTAFRKFCYPNAKHGENNLQRRPLSPQQESIYNLCRVGWNPKQIAERIDMHESSVRDAICKIRHNGYPI